MRAKNVDFALGCFWLVGLGEQGIWGLGCVVIFLSWMLLFSLLHKDAKPKEIQTC